MPQFNCDRLQTLPRLRRMALLLASLILSLQCGAPQAQLPQTELTRDGLSPSDPLVTAVLPRYLNSRAASLVDWLSDGSLLVTTRFGDNEQVHRLRIPLGERTQQTFAAQGITSAAARPYASDALAYLETHRDTDSTQLLLQHIDNHVVTPLTDGRHRDGPPIWAHDGKLIAFASNRRNGIDTDIYLLDTAVAGAEPRLVVGGMGYRWQIYDWSSDDQRLLLGRSGGSDAGGVVPDAGADCELYIAHIQSGQLTPIAGNTVAGSDRKPHGAKGAAAALPARARGARFAADGRGVLLLTHENAAAGADDADAQFQHLTYTDPISHEWRDLTPEVRHDVDGFDRSADGRYLAYTINDGGMSRLALIDQQRKLELAVTELPAGIISGLKFDDSGKRLALTLESTRSAPDVYVFEPDTHALTQWTQSEAGALDTQAFVAPETLRFPTWDRVGGKARELPALIYRVATPAAATPQPVLIVLCGGGGAQCRPNFDPFLQYLVNELGFAVLAPNLRGSGGDGARLEALGEGALRDDAVRDVGSLLVWIGLQRELDRNRVAILGEGFGSYLALESLAAYGDRLRGGIAAFGPRLSPLGNIPAIRRPLLLVQGLNNPAAPASELEQLRARLRAEGVEVQYLGAAQEGQDFSRQSDRDAYHIAAANFLVQLLR